MYLLKEQAAINGNGVVCSLAALVAIEPFECTVTIGQVEEHDPYLLSEAAIKEPPRRWRERLFSLGPGLVLSAGIVGSGELIATTTLGAEAGFTTLWVILISCVVKVFLQLEFGKHAIHTGETTLGSFARLPGPRLGKASWSVWSWLLITVIRLIQGGGIVGGVALAVHLAFPSIDVVLWSWIGAISAALLVFRGYYRLIEKLALGMMAVFTLFTIACVLFLEYTPYSVSQANILEGLQFKLPRGAVLTAIAAFGITGVGGDEVILYNYWCLEKGYAAYTGPKRGTPEWVRRAKGWIKVMYLDAFLSMVVYTTATVAFYVLGASVLHGRGEIPQGFAMVETLSRMYTETLGPWASGVFLFGAFVVLYSTLFVGLAGLSRMFSDALGQVGLIDFWDRKVRMKWVAILSWIFPSIWCLLFQYMKSPVLMVKVGGIGGAVQLMLVIFVAIHYRYVRLSKELLPGKGYDVGFWLSVAMILLVCTYGMVRFF